MDLPHGAYGAIVSMVPMKQIADSARGICFEFASMLSMVPVPLEALIMCVVPGTYCTYGVYDAEGVCDADGAYCAHAVSGACLSHL